MKDVEDIAFTPIHWDDDEYVVSPGAPAAIGGTLSKEDAIVVARWLNGSGYKEIASTVADRNKKSGELHRWDGRDRELRRLIAAVDGGLVVTRDYLKGRHRNVLRQKERIKSSKKNQ